MDIQSLIDSMSAQWRRERAETQMTLGKLIDRLAELAPETMVEISSPVSYRGYYSDLAFAPGQKVAASLALEYARKCMGKTFTGYKGGEYVMERNTPVWAAHYGDCGMKIMAINDDGTLVLAEDE